MLFYSPHANLQVICSPTRIRFHPVTGDEISRVPGIWANFGKLGPTYEYTNPETGATDQGAEIVGHYFDTDLEAVQQDWDQDTKDLVERKLLGLCKREPARCQLIEREVARAGLPWPTYDQADADQAVVLASQLGLVEEALAYERENAARPHVIDGLQAVLADSTEDEDVGETPVPVSPQLDPKKLEELSKTITV